MRSHGKVGAGRSCILTVDLPDAIEQLHGPNLRGVTEFNRTQILRRNEPSHLHDSEGFDR